MAKDSELHSVPAVLDSVKSRGFTVDVAVLDKATTLRSSTTDSRAGTSARPVIPLRETPAVKAWEGRPAEARSRRGTFAGSDAKRGASKWRRPPLASATSSRRG